MFLTYLVHKVEGMYRQKGIFSSNIATFRKAYFAALIIFCVSESGDKFGSRQPNRTSRATRPIPEMEILSIKKSRYVF